VARILGILLIVAGTAGLAYGGFSFLKDSRDVKLGPIQLSVKQTETINVPVWAGVAGIATGALLLLLGGRK
jgi:hypothetical protein